MKKLILLVNLVSALFVLVAVQIHGSVPFDFESEFPQDSEASKFSYESQYFPKSNDEETFQFSESGFPQEFEYPDEFFESQQVPYEIDAGRKIKSPAPSPSKEPSPSQSYVPSPSPSEPENCINYKCSLNCSKTEIPILRGLCDQVCSTECQLRHSIQLYNCIFRCAESMPEIFKSDKEKAARYIDYCIDKCNKES